MAEIVRGHDRERPPRVANHDLYDSRVHEERVGEQCIVLHDHGFRAFRNSSADMIVSVCQRAFDRNKHVAILDFPRIVLETVDLDVMRHNHSAIRCLEHLRNCYTLQQ